MSGRVALVTGGGGGIGEATARLFAEEDGAVVLVDVDGDAARTAAASIGAAVPGARVLALGADVADEADARRAVETAVARFGALHALVNVAGIRVYATLAEATAEDWRRIVDVNVLATAFCAKAALARLRAAADGTIVNVSSVFGVLGRAGMGQYDTTKAAVLGFTRALAVEEARHGIRVNAVCPGGTITRYHVDRAARQGVSEAELRGARAADNGLFGRWAEPREVAYPILFLSCRESSFMTGTALMVDAGKSIL
ncbi:MAG TPA: SDR family NAD(P)-dependent oxidoreductase [Methylomirabilota bacterium]|jgi:meso-butanediol dehydrogenase/(S,S)-butanediol dehydrogenase/diacetyl reductase|nr:SDR family NAD(P)-dependent oxidoreductase [Methylomirabilota bacterium]